MSFINQFRNVQTLETLIERRRNMVNIKKNFRQIIMM